MLMAVLAGTASGRHAYDKRIKRDANGNKLGEVDPVLPNDFEKKALGE